MDGGVPTCTRVDATTSWEAAKLSYDWVCVELCCEHMRCNVHAIQTYCASNGGTAVLQLDHAGYELTLSLHTILDLLDLSSFKTTLQGFTRQPCTIIHFANPADQITAMAVNVVTVVNGATFY
jgi:hypothetical protein